MEYEYSSEKWRERRGSRSVTCENLFCGTVSNVLLGIWEDIRPTASRNIPLFMRTYFPTKFWGLSFPSAVRMAQGADNWRDVEGEDDEDGAVEEDEDEDGAL